MPVRALAVTGVLGMVAVLSSVPVGDRAAAQPADPALKELQPRTFTLRSNRVTLNEALEEFAKQTGIPVRNATKADPAFPLQCDGLPFWQALDRIAAAAGARIALYQADGNLALVAAPAKTAAKAPPVSYHGLFRTTVKQVATRLDFESGSHTCAIQLEVAWEPRLLPFLVDLGPTAVVFGPDANGNVLKGALPSRGQVAVTGRSALEVDVRVPAPHRSATTIAELTGSFVVTAPSKMLTFTFDKLGTLDKGAAHLKQGKEGVTVQVSNFLKEPDRWTFDVIINNPPGGPRFESYQSWLGNNAIWLEKGAGNAQQRLLPSVPEEVDKLDASQAVVRYSFAKKRNPGVSFGSLANWTLVYRTPGRMVELKVPFAFKKVPLP